MKIIRTLSLLFALLAPTAAFASSAYADSSCCPGPCCPNCPKC